MYFFQAFDAVEAAQLPTMHVKPLQSSEKNEIVTGYLEGIYGKTLSEEQKDMIVNTDKTNNPLYLKALMDEVRRVHLEISQCLTGWGKY